MSLAENPVGQGTVEELTYKKERYPMVYYLEPAIWTGESEACCYCLLFYYDGIVYYRVSVHYD